jgi:hypothetical protein
MLYYPYMMIWRPFCESSLIKGRNQTEEFNLIRYYEIYDHSFLPSNAVDPSLLIWSVVYFYVGFSRNTIITRQLVLFSFISSTVHFCVIIITMFVKTLLLLIASYPNFIISNECPLEWYQYQIFLDRFTASKSISGDDKFSPNILKL